MAFPMMEDSGIGMTSKRTRERLIIRLKEEGIKNKHVLSQILSIPRHLFVDEALSSRAYEDTALPIGKNQTISQPYIVARMTELILEKGPLENILEVGTGSGYQTAVLSALVKRIYTVERIENLLIQARQRFRKLKLKNVRTKYGDGIKGWEHYSPYDAIIVTAAPQEIPLNLVSQLKIDGRLILPIGDKDNQKLICVTRTQGSFKQEVIEKVMFVPLLSGMD